MITRKIFVEQIRNYLSGGQTSINSALSELETGKLVDQIANGVIEIECKDDSTKRQDFVVEYENVPILFDANKKLYYSTIKRIISLNDTGGVYQVSTMQDQSAVFICCPADALFRFSDIKDLLGDNAGFFNEQLRIYYLNYSPTTNTDSALIKLIVDRSELDEEEDYRIPAGMIEDKIKSLVIAKFQSK